MYPDGTHFVSELKQPNRAKLFKKLLEEFEWQSTPWPMLPATRRLAAVTSRPVACETVHLTVTWDSGLPRGAEGSSLTDFDVGNLESPTEKVTERRQHG
jgi:hypothetical protein